MTFDSKARTAGRQILYLLELELDSCANTYGQAPCTANGVIKCYNTRRTCQDPANWNPAGKVYTFIPVGMHPDLHPDLFGAIPSIVGEPNFASSEAEPGGLGRRASVTVQLYEMIAGDRIQDDPYVAERTVAATGGWWARFQARNEFYTGRPMRVREGYADEPIANWITRNYVIEEINGPTSDGRVTIKGSDPLKQLDGDRSLFPRPSETTLAEALLPAELSIELSDATNFFNNDEVQIEDERVRLGGFDGSNTFTTCTRGVNNTTAVLHEQGTSVQKVFVVTASPLEQLISDILTQSGVDSAYIPFAEWQQEIATFLPGRTVTGEIQTPTPPRKLLDDELLPENNLSMFWDEVAQLIRLRVGSAFQNVAVTLNTEEHILDGQLTLKDEPRRQVTTCRFFYGQTPANLGRPNNRDEALFFQIFKNADLESSQKYNRLAAREFASRWYGATDANNALTNARQWVERFGTMPKIMTFAIDAKDLSAINIGDVIDVLSDSYVDYRGQRRPFRGQVLTLRPIIPGHSYEVRLLKYFAPEASVIPDVINITANQSNYDLHSALGLPPNPIEIEVVINPGVVISSSGSLPAFTTGALDPSSVVTITRLSGAIITGHGGAGGGDASLNGRTGGTGLEMTCDCIINNSENTGYIAGGGGGGAAGGVLAGVDGGGGGAGTIAGAGGVAGGGADPGDPGTATTGGAAGDSFAGNPDVFAGAGGDLGQPGAPGRYQADAAPVIYVDTVGGAAGFSINTNGFNLTIDDATSARLIGPVNA